MTDEKRVALVITCEELVEILRLPADAKITCMSFGPHPVDDQSLRIIVETEHGFYVHKHGVVPVAPLAKLQIKRLEEEL